MRARAAPLANPSLLQVLPDSPSGVEESVMVSPKSGRWTKREDDLLRNAIDDLGAEVSAGREGGRGGGALLASLERVKGGR